MIARTLVVALGCLLGFSNVAANEGIEIPAQRRLSLKVVIPIADKATALLTIYERDGRCAGKLAVGKQAVADFDFGLTPPCDLMTRGSDQGFAPRVKFDRRGEKPNAVSFRVVGSLRYYPDYRAECSKEWRDVVLVWPGPRMSFSDAYVESHKGVDFCPRFYNDVKWWSGMDW